MRIEGIESPTKLLFSSETGIWADILYLPGLEPDNKAAPLRVRIFLRLGVTFAGVETLSEAAKRKGIIGAKTRFNYSANQQESNFRQSAKH